MEGIVMELNNNHVVVMTNTGEFIKLKKHGTVNIGDVYRSNPYHTIPISAIIAAAIFIFVITSFAGYRAYANQIVGYMDIAGKKTVRLYISRNGTVKKVDGLENTKALKNLPIEKAVEEVLSLGAEEGIYAETEVVTINTMKTKEAKIDFNSISKKAKEIVSIKREDKEQQKEEKLEKKQDDKEQKNEEKNKTPETKEPKDKATINSKNIKKVAPQSNATENKSNNNSNSQNSNKNNQNKNNNGNTKSKDIKKGKK